MKLSNPSPRSTRLRLLLTFLLFLAIGITWFLSCPTPAPPTLILPLSANMPKNNLPWFDRLVPYSWSWFWRMKPHLFGPPGDVNIQTQIFEFDPTSLVPNLLQGGTELANTNGFRALHLSADELKNLRDCLAKPSSSNPIHLQLISAPRIDTADAVGSSLYMGDTQSAIYVGAFPRIHGQAIDLATTFLFTETVGVPNSTNILTKTNLALWTRSRIPDDSSLFLMECPPGSDKTNLLGILITVNLPSPTKPTAKSVQAQTKP